MRGIVVGVSASATGAAALDWAVEQAVLRKLPVTAVRAWDLPSYGGYYSVGSALRSTSVDFELTEVQIAQDALRAAMERVPGADTLDGRAVATRGRPAEVLVEAAKEAELLVIGTRGVGALTRVVHLGSVSSSVLHHAKGVVAVVPERAAGAAATRRIVVGVDDSPRSHKPLAWAVEQARLHGAVLVPVSVRHQDRKKDDAGDHAAERQSLVAAAERAGASEGQPVVVQPEVRIGHTAHELIAAAATADELVVGTRGRGGFASLLLGSTAHQVAGHATCPVVVVRTD